MIKMGNEQAHNLKLGAIYVLRGTYEKVRLLQILRQCVWVENGIGSPMAAQPAHLLYANDEEVKNFLETS